MSAQIIVIAEWREHKVGFLGRGAQVRSQNERLLEALRHGAAVTPYYAQVVLSIGRLAARVLELKQAGEDIRSEFVTVQNQFGEPCRVKQYRLATPAA